MESPADDALTILHRLSEASRRIHHHHLRSSFSFETSGGDIPSGTELADRLARFLTISTTTTAASTSTSSSDVAAGSEKSPCEPHEAFFFVLSYLGLKELFSLRMVCGSLRDAVDGDPLLWRDLCVERPINSKLTNESLLTIAGNAKGKLRSLTLKNCWSVTDEGIRLVLDQNPSITELHVPGCFHLTADALLQTLEILAEQKSRGILPLKCLTINGIGNLRGEHLNNFIAILNRSELQEPFITCRNYGRKHSFSKITSKKSPIDIGICPKCQNVRLVYDCTKETCRQKRDHPLTQCRGCLFCIARCEECGGCIQCDDFCQTFCFDLVCQECWLQLPKCKFCNQSGCHRQADHMLSRTESGFICPNCYEFQTY